MKINLIIKFKIYIIKNEILNANIYFFNLKNEFCLIKIFFIKLINLRIGFEKHV